MINSSVSLIHQTRSQARLWLRVLPGAARLGDRNRKEYQGLGVSRTGPWTGQEGFLQEGASQPTQEGVSLDEPWPSWVQAVYTPRLGAGGPPKSLSFHRGDSGAGGGDAGERRDPESP